MPVAIGRAVGHFRSMGATAENMTKAAAKRAAALESVRRSGKDWRKVFGWAAGDPLHAEAVKLGAEYRRVQNQDVGHADS